MSWRGFARKACVIEKIRGAKQKSGLKPPPLVVDSPILANFLPVENIELLAETISEIGHKHDSTDLLEKALQLFEICNLRDRTFSIEREAKIGKIKSTLQ